MNDQIKQMYAPKLQVIPDNLSAGDRHTFVVVSYTDHLASHGFDEEVERAAFEAEYPDLTKKRCVNAPDIYWSAMTQNWWEIWLRCAKSRAKRFGMSENGDS